MIKKNNFQDAKNKRNINADENLLAVFDGKNQVSMFEMTKLVKQGRFADSQIFFRGLRIAPLLYRDALPLFFFGCFI